MDIIEQMNEDEVVLDFPDEQLLDLEEPNDNGIEKNLENIEINPDDNIKQKIFEGLEEKDKTELLMAQALEFYKYYKLENNDEGLELMKSIISEVSEFSNYNISARLINFFKYILSTKVDLDTIIGALKIKVADLEKDNNKDIIYFWKQFIAEEHLKKQKIIINSEDMKNCVKSLIEHNFNLNQIYHIFSLFFNVIINKKNPQFEIINSLIAILITYPQYFDKNEENKKNDDGQKEEELKSFIDKYIEKIKRKNKEGFDEVEYIFNKEKNVALDFYLKISSDKNSKKSHELEIPEIFQYLKMNNPGISDKKIKTIEEQLSLIHATINNPRYRNFEQKDFQDWAKLEVPKLKFDEYNSERSTCIILGMISLAIKKSKEMKKEKGYLLRNTQLIAILLFISKEAKKGLIEEISTGEGKSSIICSLSIYFALRKHKVDIISSSYTLAQRDSDEFKTLYSFFNLTTGYPFDSKPEPYSTDILYGTFFEFEGDCLREMTSKNKIREDRPYDVIIVDEVDNLFIDNILGSTRLTNSSRGFKFLIPIYLTIYISFELFDYFFLLFFKIALENSDNNDAIKAKFESLIKNPEKRKKEIINMMLGEFTKIFNYGKNIQDKKIPDNVLEKVDEQMNKIENNKDLNEFLDNINKFLEYPDFLHSFVEGESSHWIDKAYDAKNLMEENRDYVEVINRNGFKDISPVDRDNTGETQLSTVYSEGLHQMLEIKHKFRVKEESLVHTFLSNISFFQNYKNEKEFLFFGLTGTIGNKESQKIYKSTYFDSNLLFIPQYKKKRFVELPPLLVNIKEHYTEICKDIVNNFYKGRKILVICSSIGEALSLQEKLINNFDIKILNLPDDIIQKEDYKESIVLYTRSDTETSNIKKKDKRIILSTNLGGRGTDIKTTEFEEEAGGLHVILTYMPNNYRVLKQAFGRTSREGKKGTGQIILKNIGNSTYNQIKNEMIENEQKHIKYIEKKLRILLFKDKLFKEYIELVKDVDYRGYLIDDLNEKWAEFLNINVSHNENLDTNKIKQDFEKFKENIKYLINNGELHKKFENPFYQMQEGLRIYRKYEKGLLNFFNFDSKQKKFYFSQPYVKAIIKIVNTDKYSKQFFKEVSEEFEESIKRIDLIIEENINPVLNSFDQWGKVLENFESMIEIIVDHKNYYVKEPFSDGNFIKSDLCKQYSNIKIICNKIKERIEENKIFIQNFEAEYEKDKNILIHVTEEDLMDGLALSDEEIKEEEFFSDATFRYVYKLTKIKLMNLETSFWSWLLIGAITLFGGFVGALFITAVTFIYNNIISNQVSHNYYIGNKISTDSLFGNLFYIIFNKAKSNININRNKSLNFTLEQNFTSNKTSKSNLFEKIMESIEEKFVAIKKSSKILDFLIFVDYYYSEDIWAEKIKKLLIEKFELVYKSKFIEDIFFKSPITEKTLKEHLNKYNELFDIYLEECIKEIMNLGNKKKFSKEDGLNCLEHLIIDLNSEKIDENMANIIVQQMLEQGLFLEDGRVNHRLFEKYFLTKDEKILDQNVKLNIINRKKNKVNKLKSLEEFKIRGIEIPLVNSSFIDLANFYQIHGYKVQEHLEKDFSLFILNNFKLLLIKLLNMNPDIFKNFYKYCLNLVKNLIKNLLYDKVFNKYNKKSFENIISEELSAEEKTQFNKLIENAKENAINLMKKNN